MVEVDGKTIHACLNDLERKFPSLQGQYFNGSNRLRNNIFIEVNVVRDLLEVVENRNPEDKPVTDGDELYICVTICGMGWYDD